MRRLLILALFAAILYYLNDDILPSLPNNLSFFSDVDQQTLTNIGRIVLSLIIIVYFYQQEPVANQQQLQA